jgi:hypothetical protein
MAAASISKQEQYHHENMTWGRSLDFFRQENSFLKNRLSEVVDHQTSKDFLALAEHFQNSFILKDEFMDELKHDINAQEKVLKDNFISGKTELGERTMKLQDKLRNEMEYLEKDFAQLKNEFNKYLASVL